MDSGLKLSVYFGERQRVGSAFLADDLLELFGGRQVASSILMRGVAGFGLRHHLRTDQVLSLSEDAPLLAMAVDAPDRMVALAEEVSHRVRRGLITVERNRVLGDVDQSLTLPESLEEATKLTIYVGRHQRVYRVPAWLAICDLLRRRGIAGASVFVGVDGTAHGSRERARFWKSNLDVPAMVVAVGSGSRIRSVLPALDAVVSDPMVTLERVRVCKRDGELLARPHALPERDGDGLALWQKLMVFTSEADLHDGRPIHREVVRRLRRDRLSRGATVLRGIWGFHGDHEPHGDRLLRIGRRVPVAIMVVDTPDRIAAAFDIVDELTSERGLVTSEMVPAAAVMGDDGSHGGLRLAHHRF